MKKLYCKYIMGLLLFGSNGIVANYIALSSYEIVLLRTLIGSLFLILIFFASREKLTFYHHKKQFLWLSISGIFCGLLSAVMYSLMVIFNKKAKAITGLENAALQLIISFLTVAIFVGLKQGFSIAMPQSGIAPIFILGLLNTGIGCYFYFSTIGNLPVQTVAILGYLEPLSAVLFSFLLLGERLLPLQIIGAVMILGGAALGELTA